MDSLYNSIRDSIVVSILLVILITRPEYASQDVTNTIYQHFLFQLFAIRFVHFSKLGSCNQAQSLTMKTILLVDMFIASQITIIEHGKSHDLTKNCMDNDARLVIHTYHVEVVAKNIVHVARTLWIGP